MRNFTATTAKYLQTCYTDCEEKERHTRHITKIWKVDRQCT